MSSNCYYVSIYIYVLLLVLYPFFSLYATSGELPVTTSWNPALGQAALVLSCTSAQTFPMGFSCLELLGSGFSTYTGNYHILRCSTCSLGLFHVTGLAPYCIPLLDFIMPCVFFLLGFSRFQLCDWSFRRRCAYGVVGYPKSASSSICYLEFDESLTGCSRSRLRLYCRLECN